MSRIGSHSYARVPHASGGKTHKGPARWRRQARDAPTQGYGLGVLEQAESQCSGGGHGGAGVQELAQNFVDGHEDGIENVHFASFCVFTCLERGMGPRMGTALFTRLVLAEIVAPPLHTRRVQNYDTQTTCVTGFATLKGLLRHRVLLTLPLCGTIPTEKILLTRGS